MQSAESNRAQLEPGTEESSASPGSATAVSATEVSRSALVPLSRPKEPLNVILFSVEAWRADMPWAGYARPITPNLSQLAREGSVWENHRAVSSHTPQALAALLSGRYVSSLHRDGAELTTFGSEDLLLPEVLQRRGIRTIGIQANTYFEPGRGFEQGFDVWEVVPGAGSDLDSTAQTTADQQASRLIDLLGQTQNTGHQFFAWAHLMDLKGPYVRRPGIPQFGEQARDRYDAEVFFTDLWLGRFLEFARHQGWWERTAVIVTGDHGEAFGEHGLSKHAGELWDVLLRTPLLIHSPGAKPTRIAEPRSQIDLAPTVVDLMGLPSVPEFVGQSLVPELYGARAAARPALLFELCDDTKNPGLRALVSGDDKLIVPEAGGDERLYDLKGDPGELENVAEAQGKKLRELAVRFEREWGRIPRLEPSGGKKLRGGRLAQRPKHAGR